MLVIIEGPDGAGKTTLIDKLIQSKRYFVLIRNSGPPREVVDIYRFLNLIDNIPPAQPVILDRHPCISDRIYGPLLRSMDLLRDKPSNWMLSRAELIVYCRPPTETILENVARTKGTQLGGVLENASKIIAEYDRLFLELSIHRVPIVNYNYLTDDWQSLAKNDIDKALKL